MKSNVLAYMAPEVFMKSNTEGHGRAADIWSIGCVIIEMASGKVCIDSIKFVIIIQYCYKCFHRDRGMSMIPTTKSYSKWAWVSCQLYQTHCAMRANSLLTVVYNMIRTQERLFRNYKNITSSKYL